MAEHADGPFDEAPGSGAGGGRGKPSRRFERDWLHWSDLTAGEDLPTRLARITADAKLALERRTIARMRAAAVLVDLDRLLAAASARLLFHATEYQGDVALGDWTEPLIDQSIEDLLNEDAIEERDDRPVPPYDRRYLRLAQQLGIDTRTFRRATIIFHRMPHEERAVFWAVLVDQKTVEQHAAATRVRPRIARRRFERAIATFCSLGTLQDPRDDQGGLQ